MRKRHKYKNIRLGDKKDMAIKFGFTFLFIAIFKLLSFVPAPFVNAQALRELVSNLTILQTAQLFSGHSITALTLMATGVSSYITASIVVQFLTYGIKKLHDISKSSSGEKVIKNITMGLGLVMSIITSLVLTIGLSKQNPDILTNTNWYAYVAIAAFHALGTFIAITLGNAIDKKGYGNGLSLLISVNVVSSIPAIASSLIAFWPVNKLAVLVILALTVIMMSTIILVDSSEKKIPVTYSRIVARSTGHMKSEKQTMPMKVNSSGVMPIILASTILQVATFLFGLINNPKINTIIATIMNPADIYYGITISALIVIFTFVYAGITFDAGEVSESLQKNGGAILGIRPGKDTKEYLKKTNKGLTIVSAAYLLFVSAIPIFITGVFGFSGIQSTSLMIIVGVSLDTISKFINEYKLGKMKF